MRKDYLHSVLMNPEGISDEQLMELRETVARFPFFGAAQIALTQALKARGDIQFTDQLSQAGIYTSHRAMLYKRMKSVSQSHTEQHNSVREISIAEKSSLASRILDVEERHESTLAPHQQAHSDIREEVIAATEHASNVSLEVAAAPTPESEPFEEIVHVKLAELDPLEGQILVSAVNTVIELEVQTEQESFDGEIIPELDLEPDDETSYAAQIYRRAQRIQQQQNEFGATDEQENEIDLSEDESLPAFQATPLSHGIRRIKTTDANKQQRNLIDKFIQGNPQIARGKSGEYPTGNLAKDSLEEDFSMVTETMAVLFAKQGKLDKARKAFRKLMEQHPEKSIYFAAQLKNLDHFKK
jgi:tetratricopeptide (TPR) repeat protein